MHYMDEGKGKMIEAPELSAEERIAMLTEQLAEKERELQETRSRLQELNKQHKKDLQRIKRLEGEVTTDPLTNLLNRRGGDREAARILNERRGDLELEKEQRVNKRDIAVLALDIDYFGKFNKLYGQDAGDEVLKEVARRLQEGLRKADLVIRRGGEEIMIVLPGVNDKGAYNFLFKKFGNDGRKFESGDHPQIIFPVEVQDENGKPVTVEVTFSGGIADWKEGASFEETQKIADDLLREAKRMGRNRILRE